MPSTYASGPRATRRAAALAALTAVLALPCAARVAPAQGATVTNPPRTVELGIDAGAVFGLGDESSISITLPAARARLGVVLTNNTRWSLEPAALLSFTKVEGADAVLLYNLEGGMLYHFRPPADLADAESEAARRVTVAYVRPFVNLTGYTGEDGDSELSVGAGLGVKVPWRPQLAWRLEANFGYGFDNEAFRLGAFAGLSFFTRRGP